MNRYLNINEEYYSQFGEDILLKEIFFSKDNGICVEVGAFNGITHSNTYYFEKIGWTCILIEPIKSLYKQLILNRNSTITYNVAVSNKIGESTFYLADGPTKALSSLDIDKLPLELIRSNGGKIKEIKVKTTTLNQILEENKISKIDFITIDTEGHEYEVLEGFNLNKYSPKVLIIEDNSLIINKKIDKYMSNNGYSLFNRTGKNYNYNLWYARKGDPIINIFSFWNNYIKQILLDTNIIMRKYLRSLYSKSVHS